MRLARLIAISIFFALLISCKPETPQGKICGKIEGYANQTIAIYSAEDVYINLPYADPLAVVSTDNEGSFQSAINVDEVALIHLFTIDSLNLVATPIVLHKNDSIHLKTSVFNTSRPSFSGKGWQINDLLFRQRAKLEQEFRDYSMFEWPIFMYSAYCDSLQLANANCVDSLADTKLISPKLIALAKADARLFIAFKRFEYLQNHINQTQATWGYLLPTAEYYHFKQTLFESTADYWFLPSYSQAIGAMLEDDFQNLPVVLHNPTQAQEKQFLYKLSIIEHQYSGMQQQVSLVRLASNFPKFLDEPNAFNLIDKADSLMQMLSQNTALNQFYLNKTKSVSQIKPGLDAPNITLPNSAGQLVSLSSFRGNVVLLVFWGTWCPPCLASMPKYIDIQNHFRDMDVTFMFVSLEALTYDIENWRSFIRGEGKIASQFLHGKPFTGVHVVAKGQFQNSQVKPYAITYAPSYVLIGKDGRIVEPRVHLDHQLIEKITALLEIE